MTSHRRAIPARLLTAVAFAGLVVVLAAQLRCSKGTTSLFVELQLPSELDVRQLELEGFDDTRQLFGPDRRPESEGGTLAERETVRVLLPDALDGRTVRVRVRGFREGAVVGGGEGTATVERGAEVPLAILLERIDPEPPPPPDGGCPQCASGCCLADGGCDPGDSVFACGDEGNVCVACTLLTADRCTDGACACGDGGTCAEGQYCDAGSCVCGPPSCAGCCSENRCQKGDVVSLCGNGGIACVSCGAGGSCSALGICEGCSAATCANGCCSGTCRAWSLDSCGLPGGPCSVCDGRSDHCDAGTCGCGTQGACAQGTRCVGGQCVCDAQSGCAGCCQGDVCLPGTAQNACGRSGAECKSCLLSGCSATGNCL